MGQLVKNYEARSRLAAQRLPNRLLVDARRGARPHNKTGRMVGSLRTRGTYQAGVIRVTITSDQVQTITTNFGARPHVIVPRRKRVLHWRTGGRDFFARRVNHPGNRAFGWLTRVLDTWPRMVADELRRAR